MDVYLIETKLVDFLGYIAHNGGKTHSRRAGIQIHLPFRVCWKKVSLVYMHFAPLGKGQWAVTGESSQIAEVTVGRAHCALTPTKGCTITPDEWVGMGAFMQTACPVGRKCGRCPERC